MAASEVAMYRKRAASASPVIHTVSKMQRSASSEARTQSLTSNIFYPDIQPFWDLERLKLETAQAAQRVLTPMEKDDELIKKLEDQSLHPVVKMEIMKSVGEQMNQRRVKKKLADLVKSNLQTTVSQFGQPRPCAHKEVQVSMPDHVAYLDNLVRKHEEKFEEVLEKLGSLNPYDHPIEKEEVLEHQHQLWKSLYLDIIAWLGGPHRLRKKAIDSDNESDDSV